MKTSEKIYDTYVSTVNKLDIVQQVGITQTPGGTTIWTMIDATPFDDSLRMPIYDAQLEVLRGFSKDIAIDFHVVNIAELRGIGKLEDILPRLMKPIWTRQGSIAQKSHNVI